MKIETWSEHDIRFVEKDGEWWAVLADICVPLGLQAYAVKRRIKDEQISNMVVTDRAGKAQDMIIVNTKGVYSAIFQSRKPEALDFKDWVFDVIDELRKSIGLAGYEIYRMLDKELQKDAMKRLHDGLLDPVRVDYIKANTIANKTVSNIHGYPKMVKKSDMRPEWLGKRQKILEETVELMTANERFNLGISVSDVIYAKHA